MLTPRDISTHLNSPKEGMKHGKPVIYALCPYHDERTRSLMVGPDNGFYCFGCGMSGHINQLAEYLGMMPPRERTEYFGRRPVNNGTVGNNIGEWGEYRCTYTYRDERGIALYDVVRYSPKSFRIRRHCFHTDGQYLGRQWGIGGKRRVLYHLPSILGRMDETVIIVEGEKDADRLHGLKILATTTTGGAQAFGGTNTSHLVGRNVVCIPDDDSGGSDYRAAIEERLGRDAARFNVIELPFGDGRRNTKRDVSDWLNAGHTKGELLCLIKR